MPNHRTGYVAQYKDGRWFARVTVTDERGRRRNVVRRAKDRFEAQETLRTLLGQIEESGSKAIDAARMTFHDLANYYQSHYLQPAEYVDGRKISGLRDVQRPLGCLNNFRAYFGKKKLRQITYGDIYAYRSLRLRTPTHYNRPRTIADWNREASVLRRILNIALREGWITKNPFLAGEPLIIVSFERRRERILTMDEERRMLAACDHPQRRAIIYLTHHALYEILWAWKTKPTSPRHFKRPLSISPTSTLAQHSWRKSAGLMA